MFYEHQLEMIALAKRMASDPALDLVLIHLPIPHPPFFLIATPDSFQPTEMHPTWTTWRWPIGRWVSCGGRWRMRANG